MGNQEEKNLKELYSALALYVQDKSGVQYKDQAARLGLSPSQFQHRRTDSRYVIAQRDIDEYQAEFWKELEGFGDPSPLQAELEKYIRLAREQAARLERKDEVIETLARILEDPQREQELLARVMDLLEKIRERQ